MTGAGVILLINVFVGGLLCAFFLGIALYHRGCVAARWFAAAYGLGVLWVLSEFVIPAMRNPVPLFVLASVIFVAALLAINVGIARRFAIRPGWPILAAVFVLSVVAFVTMHAVPRETLLRMYLYQTPFALAQFIGVAIIMRASARRWIDYVLAGVLALSALHFLAKPLMAIGMGGDGASLQDYMTTSYALLSQSAGTVIALANALVLMAMLIGDILRDMNTRSETDLLSGLYNRRGFEERLFSAVLEHERKHLPLSLIICDLDHFKAINDSHGHAMGDRVIARFAQTLREAVGDKHVVGRIGGEEYAVAMFDTRLTAARVFAEGVRTAFSQCCVEGLDGTVVTASLGVAERERGEGLPGLMERADRALYAAKAAGRNCVKTAETGPALRLVPNPSSASDSQARSAR